MDIGTQECISSVLTNYEFILGGFQLVDYLPSLCPLYGLLGTHLAVREFFSPIDCVVGIAHAVKQSCILREDYLDSRLSRSGNQCYIVFNSFFLISGFWPKSKSRPTCRVAEPFLHVANQHD